MNKKTWVAIGAGLAIVLAVVLTFVILKSHRSNDVVIGWIGPLSGEYAAYGKQVKAGTEVAVAEINAAGGIDGRKLVVIYEDDQLDPKKGVAAFNKLVSVDGVPVVIQAAGSNVMLAEAPLAQRKKVVLISPTCTSPKISDAGDYVFRIAPSDTYQGKVIADIARNDLKASTAAVLYINNDYGVGLKDVFLARFREMGGQVTMSEGFAPETKDFRTLLGKVKADKPDVVFLSSLYQEAALILKQAQELGISAQFIGGDGCFAPELIERAGNAAEGMLVINMQWSPTSDDPKVKAFVQKIRENTSKDPEVYAALGYDCVNVVADALRRSDLTGPSIRDALQDTTALPGLTGPTSFDSQGDVMKQYDTFVIRQGEFRSAKQDRER